MKKIIIGALTPIVVSALTPIQVYATEGLEQVVQFLSNIF